MNTVLQTVYNNYLTTYNRTTPSGKYDTHNKSELRSIYNSIVEQNKNAPIYLPVKAKEVIGFAIGVKENARELRNTIASLGGLDEGSLLSQKAASTTNDDVCDATFVGKYTPGSAIPSFTLAVDRLASHQENMGKFLVKERSQLSPDTYSFDVQVGDMNYELQFAVNETETNQDIQNRLVRLINNANIGITASVREEEDRTALVLTSDATGHPEERDTIFRISDTRTSKTRGAVEYLGIDYITKMPQNASFRINGEQHSALTNDFSVGNMFELHLKGTTAEDEVVTISLKNDVDSLTDNVEQLAMGYNQFLQATHAFLESHPKSGNLLREMSRLTGAFSESFADMGVNIDEDGSIEIDRATLGEAIATSEDLTATFSPLKNFSRSLLRKSDDISLNPMQYVDRKVVAYKHPERNFVNPYTTSAYSGMLFNFYC